MATTQRKMTSQGLANHLDRLLRADRFQDDSWNGMQVANSGRIGSVCAGVDATLPFFEEAAARGAGMVICHHGLSWGTSLARITELNYRLVSFLIRNDLALWACHLPLDAHPVHGNNAVLARLLGLRNRRPFARYHGQAIGVRGELPQAVDFATFAERVKREVNPHADVRQLGRRRVRRVGVVSGGAAREVAEAIREGLDVYVTGEPTLSGYNQAMQEGMNVVYAGHYATEVFGVRAVLRLIQTRYGIPGSFVEQPGGY